MDDTQAISRENWRDDSIWNEAAARRVTEAMCASYACGRGVSYVERCGLPQRETVIRLVEQMLDVLFPGYTGHQQLTAADQYFAVGGLLNEIYCGLAEQIKRALTYRCQRGDCRGDCFRTAERVTLKLMEKLPDIRAMLLLDAEAALAGDPATKSLDEIILAYPGFKAISIHRLAHELYKESIPLIPRVMSEYAHMRTGIDINPGATIGESFFIDHGTGVVIGETAVIGARVKLYQGVTLGALSFPKDACGQIIKGHKRHPNLEDDVTVYSEASILGDITIGHHSIIGGNVWLTQSVPPNSKVTVPDAELSIEERRHRR